MPITFPDFPLADADKCVKCAMCLPHCPTWRETRNEAESPRGRIALMQGFASGALEITPQLAAHLDRCLDCRACEAVCPAEVPYGKLIDAAHAELQTHGQPEHWSAHALAWLITHPRRLRFAHGLLWMAQKLGITRLMGFSTSFRRLVRLIPALHAPSRWRADYMPAGDKRGTVNLFLGCIAQITEPEVTGAAIAVLNAAGYDVRIPPQQNCCGALDQHAGRRPAAACLFENNISAFSSNDAPVLSSASGCGATLMEYTGLVGTDSAAAFSLRHRDISRFLASPGVLDNIRFSPWPVTVVLHNPCTMRNVLKSEQYVLALLRRIPELNVVVLPASSGCCGAAGSYLINQPDMSDRLGDKLADSIAAKRPVALLTSNVGCAMHLAASLERRGCPTPVMHPVEALAQQIPGR